MTTDIKKTVISLSILIITITIFCQVSSHGFIDYDDDTYVVNNPYIQKGISTTTIKWALTTLYEANWHPLTWLSHMLDFQLFGLNPAGHHLMNVALHASNVLILFFLLNRVTGALWRSAFVACLFGVHPCHVESVAWVAERKDVLSAFFSLLALLAYVRFVERPTPFKNMAVVVMFALAIMAKPMAVTLPFVFLLLDYWPLGRLTGKNGTSFRYLLLEKTPLFILSAVSCGMTVIAQSDSHAVIPLDKLPFTARLENSLVACETYIGKMVWPHDLAVLYPFAETTSITKLITAAVLLVCITVTALAMTRRRPYVAVGWFWFLGTMVPVIGLVQVGQQAMADRYTYIPYIGLSLVIAWGVPDLLPRSRYRTTCLAVAGVAVITASSVLAWKQTSLWKDSETIFEHALKVTNNNGIMHLNLGRVLENQGRQQDAIYHYYEAVRIRDFPEAHYNLGNVLFSQNQPMLAIAHYTKAVQLKPDYGYAHNNLGVVLESIGKIPEAAIEYQTALAINPGDFEAKKNLLRVKNQQKTGLREIEKSIF